MMQYSIMLMLFLVQSVAASAQARLYMENFSIGNGETVEVALLLDNDQAATALQAKIDLPNGLQYVEGSVAKTDRVKGRAAEVQASTATGQLVIVETDGTIAAGEGAVITFQVQRNGGSDSDYDMTISDIVVSDANANQLNTVETQLVKVSFVGLKDCKFAAPEAINMTVGQEYQVDVTLKNDGVNNLSAFQGKLALPKGLEIVPGEDGKFIYSDRIPAKAEFKFQEYEGYTQFVLSSSSNYIINGTEGVIFSFKVKATEDLAENTEITLTDLRVAATTGQSGLSPDVTISVTNTSIADKAAFEAYKTEQAAAVVAMAAEGDSEASQQLITDAKAAIEALIFDYAKSLDENKALVDAIVEKLTTDLAAQRAEDAEAAAVAAANAKLADLKTAAEALKVSDEAMAIDNALVNAAVTAAEQAIADANTAIGAVETVIAEGKLATENKEKLATAIAASEQAIADAQTAIATVDETYAGVLAADKLAQEKTAAEALKVSDEAKAYDNETVKAAVATAEQAIADANTAIAAVEAVIAEGNLATENKEKLATAIAAADKAIVGAQTAIATAEEVYNTVKAGDEEAAAVKAANEKLAQEKTAAEALKVSDEAKAYDNETVKAAVATAEQAIADANTAIAAVEAVIAEGKLATENKEKLATAIAAADKAIADAQTAVATAEQVYAEQKAAEPIPGDITGTGSVDTEDLMQFQDDFLNGDIPSKDDPKYAVYDVNGDGKVNVADLQAILNISLGLNIDGTVPGSALSRTFRMDTFEAGTMNVKAIKLSNGNTQLAIELNSNADYRALQMEVVLTGNVNIVGENAEGMALRSKNLNNIYRVIGYGQLESNGTMLTLEAAGDGTVSFNNVVLATPEAEAVEFNLCGTNGTELSLGDTTGINTIAVEAYEGNTIYDLSGKRMNGIKKGINIIRDQNGEIKKVLK